MTLKGSTSGFGADDGPSKEDLNLEHTLKSTLFRELQNHSPEPIRVLGDHLSNINFGVSFDKATDALSLDMVLMLKHQMQNVRYGVGRMLHKQQSIFVAWSSVVERIIVSLQDETLRSFYVSHIFDPEVTGILDAQEAEGHWQKRLDIQVRAEGLRECLLHGTPDSLMDFRKTHEGVSAEGSKVFPYRPEKHVFNKAFEELAVAILLSVFERSPEAAELLDTLPTDDAIFVPAYNGNGEFAFTLDIQNSDAGAIEDVLEIDSQQSYTIPAPFVAAKLNSMNSESAAKVREIIAAESFHAFFDLLTDGFGGDLSVQMIHRIYLQMMAGNIPVYAKKPPENPSE